MIPNPFRLLSRIRSRVSARRAWPRRLAAAVPLAATLMLLAQAPGHAQSAEPDPLKGVWLTTPYPELVLRPGQKESVPLTLKNADLPPQRARLEVKGLPDDWQWTLKGGGREVSAAIVAPDDSERLSLEVTAPRDSAEKSVPVQVIARTDTGVLTLPMTLRVSEAARGGVTLAPTLPALRGTAKSTFTYKVKVENNGAEDALYNLSADVPEGFQTRFKQGYGAEEITGLPVKAGASADLTMEVVPPRDVEAGRYPAVLHVADGDESAQTKLSMEVTGQPALELIAPQDRLSGSAVAGKDSSFTFVVANTGSVPVNDVTLAGAAPQGWKVTSQPETVPVLAPGARQDVNVTIRPSERAIAGDYMVTLTASGGSVSDKADFRVTVETSTVWGMVGLGVIAAAVIVLGLAITRYGRR